jgi:hypothetical protein
MSMVLAVPARNGTILRAQAQDVFDRRILQQQSSGRPGITPFESVQITPALTMRDGGQARARLGVVWD